jgi:hypothetical protein
MILAGLVESARPECGANVSARPAEPIPAPNPFRKFLRDIVMTYPPKTRLIQNQKGNGKRSIIDYYFSSTRYTFNGRFTVRHGNTMSIL